MGYCDVSTSEKLYIWQAPPYPWFNFLQVSYPLSAKVQKQMILFLTFSPKINSTLTLYHNTKPTSFPSLNLITQAFVLSHIIIRRVSTVQYDILRGRNHLHITFITASYCNSSVLLLFLVISSCASFINQALSQR